MTTKSATEAPARARRVGIVGTGVSGLATAHFLLRSGGLEKGDVLELQDERSEVGGVLKATIDGGFLFEHGAQGVLAAREAFTRLCLECGIASEAMPSDSKANARFLLLPGVDGKAAYLRLRPPLLALATRGLLTWRQFARAAFEWCVAPTSTPDPKETLYGFFARRFGAAFALRMAVPMATGIWAGGARRLLVRRAFPRLVEWESTHGSVVRGAVAWMFSKPKVVEGAEGFPRGLVSFPGGMAQFARGLKSSIDAMARERGVEVKWKFGARASVIDWESSTGPTLDSHAFDALVLAAAPRGLSLEWRHLASAPFWTKLLEGIPTHGVAVVGIGGTVPDSFPTPRGFGALAPDESDGLLGVLHVHDIYPAHVPARTPPHSSGRSVLYRLLLGGDRDPQLALESEAKLIARALSECERLGLVPPGFAPTFAHAVSWPDAIAVMGTEHDEALPAAWGVEAAAPGLFLTGNYLSGVGVADCIGEAAKAAGRVARHVANRRGPHARHDFK